MAENDESTAPGPDFGRGVAANSIAEGQSVLGQFKGEAVLVARDGGEFFAVSATCPHYGGPLAKGLITNGSVRCPLHHAAFCLRTGEVNAPPALDPLTCFELERRDDRIIVLGKKPARHAAGETSSETGPIIIVGGGATGHVAAETLRREGYAGALTLISADIAPPSDRPNLSKEYLAGCAPDSWLPLRPPEFFAEQHIELLLGTRVARLDRSARQVVLADGRALPYSKLLLATGAAPIRLKIPGAELGHVHALRSVDDARALIAGAEHARRVVVIGASFIGLEVAAALRARGLAVTVVAPEKVPFERVLGTEIGSFLRELHEAHGVVFELGRTPRRIGTDTVELDDGRSLPADLVVMGVGVRPVLDLATDAELPQDRGIVVDQYLCTSDPRVFAAGDIARWPDPHSGKSIRVEHWAVAERHGQIAARNMLGRRERCDFVPFFWTRHYDVTVQYVGHAESWDSLELDGDPAQRDFSVTFRDAGRVLAVATVGRHRESLLAELDMERRFRTT